MAAEKYMQILSEFRRRILNGEFCPENPMPSEAAVAKERKTTRNTVHRAFAELRRMGLVEGERGCPPRVTRKAMLRKIGLIVPGVVYSEFFQPVVSEISRLAQEHGYTLLFGNITSKDPVKRAEQARRFVGEVFVVRTAPTLDKRPTS